MIDADDNVVPMAERSTRHADNGPVLDLELERGDAALDALAIDADRARRVPDALPTSPR